jgi:orotate phosphoribosyltransferase
MYSEEQAKEAEFLYERNLVFLKMLLEKYSIKHGEFILRSGRKSDFYVDCRSVILNSVGLAAIGVVVSHRCWIDFQSEQFAATGVGGSYIAAATAMVTEGCILHVRDAKKKHGMKNKVEMPANFNRNHSNITIVDDVLTTGSSLALCLDSLSEVDLKVSGCIVLVDREDGGRETIENKYKIPVKSIFSRSDFT